MFGVAGQSRVALTLGVWVDGQSHVALALGVWVDGQSHVELTLDVWVDGQSHVELTLDVWVDWQSSMELTLDVWLDGQSWVELTKVNADLTVVLPPFRIRYLCSVAFIIMGWWPGYARHLQACHQFITAKCKPKFHLHCQWCSPA